MNAVRRIPVGRYFQHEETHTSLSQFETQLFCPPLTVCILALKYMHIGISLLLQGWVYCTRHTDWGSCIILFVLC
jgi:hypothetical protein